MNQIKIQYEDELVNHLNLLHISGKGGGAEMCLDLIDRLHHEVGCGLLSDMRLDPRYVS